MKELEELVELIWRGHRRIDTSLIISGQPYDVSAYSVGGVIRIDLKPPKEKAWTAASIEQQIPLAPATA